MADTMKTDTLPFPILIGDIGGTNARFSILLDADGEPKPFPNVRTADYPTIDEAIQKIVLEGSSIKPRSAILAIAGPIDGDEIDLTNCDWVVRPKGMIADLGFEDVLVVNDFEAQALAIAAMPDEYRETLGANNEPHMASRVVLGPGTGLGVAGLVYARHMWFPVPGEGGHVDVGPRSERDFEIFPHLKRIEGRVSAEEILSGRGVVNIYQAVCAADAVQPAFSDPADVTAHGLNGGNSQAVETLSLFATYLGRVAGDMALIFMARGGVYLAGGISQKIIPALKGPEFRAAFEDKAPHTELMGTIPTFVVTHPQAALAGLASFARTPSAYGLSMDGRRWQR
ncbi:glucokinase [Neorhizobium galegae]|uniref:glucokinase n=1 Tax=Neorhizobium galegae TaxID=399 RepID=UPI000622A6AC|nr:glucokinase [Neorhizobium galegae]CDZ26199.1 Glucokinase [Neorhizobium galegae bv. officinalis]KAA9385560.1 glucokinase [Neorhizobium galegae]KAB1112259.1 glucokinase [Neorhizobium galegae]MCM2499514.1 glucokinase [Neorhizobium galegae]MCQ1773168.1 glucokinase [Neorhizobium galegae]